MKNHFLILAILSICTALASCDGGPKLNGKQLPTNSNDAAKKELAIKNGQIYYETNCAGCHSAGKDDTSVAFKATDLTLTDSTNIKNDMTNNTIYGGSFDLMKRFNSVSTKRIDDLKVYLANVEKN